MTATLLVTQEFLVQRRKQTRSYKGGVPRANFLSTKDCTASHSPDTSCSLPAGMDEEASARWGRVCAFTVLLQKYTVSSPYCQVRTHQVRQAGLIPQQDHTLHYSKGACSKIHTLILPSFLPVLSFDWKWHESRLSTEEIHVSKLCATSHLLAFLPLRVFSVGRWEDDNQCLSRKDAVDHCGGNI